MRNSQLDECRGLRLLGLEKESDKFWVQNFNVLVQSLSLGPQLGDCASWDIASIVGLAKDPLKSHIFAGELGLSL